MIKTKNGRAQRGTPIYRSVIEYTNQTIEYNPDLRKKTIYNNYAQWGYCIIRIAEEQPTNNINDKRTELIAREFASNILERAQKTADIEKYQRELVTIAIDANTRKMMNKYREKQKSYKETDLFAWLVCIGTHFVHAQGKMQVELNHNKLTDYTIRYYQVICRIQSRVDMHADIQDAKYVSIDKKNNMYFEWKLSEMIEKNKLSTVQRKQLTVIPKPRRNRKRGLHND